MSASPANVMSRSTVLLLTCNRSAMALPGHPGLVEPQRRIHATFCRERLAFDVCRHARGDKSQLVRVDAEDIGRHESSPSRSRPRRLR